MQASIQLPTDPKLQYLLRIGDTCLILGQRLGEWCGHAPVLEEDIALTNMALDLIGQARGVLTLRRRAQCAQDYDEDQLAFLRDERDYLQPHASSSCRARRLRLHRAAQRRWSPPG